MIAAGNLNSVSLETWYSIVKTGIAFGSHVCGSLDNYVSKEFAEEIKSGHSGF
jgi:hypothetical protein